MNRQMIAIAALFTFSTFSIAQTPPPAPVATEATSATPVAAPATTDATTSDKPAEAQSAAPTAAPVTDGARQAAPLQIKKEEPKAAAPPTATPAATSTAVTNSKKTAAPRRLKRVLAIFEMEISGKPIGAFKAQLFPDKAPEAVENFTGLVEGRKQFKEYDEKRGKLGSLVSRPFYDGLTFHRIVTDYVVQGGCPFGTGRGGPGYFINDEISKELRHNGPGVLAMAGSGKPNTGGSQFYITLKELKHLDGKYTIFGKVIEGMDVVNKMGQVKSDRMTQVPLEPVVMKSVKIVREYFN
ncbi:MAG: peptidylprolyl isomerase [Bdellovibrionales bacterium]